MDTQEQQKNAQTAGSAPNPYLLREKCFLCQALNPHVNDENNNLKNATEENNSTDTSSSFKNSFNTISKLPLYTCPDCELKIRLEEQEAATAVAAATPLPSQEQLERMIIVPDTSSDEETDDYDLDEDEEDDDDECWCSKCSPSTITLTGSESIRQLWHDVAHIVKCVYRETGTEFTENHSSADISKAQEYVQKLTQLNSQSLFNKLESIVLEYVDEIRNQVLKRFQTCSKTSHDVQLFISFLLDEYNTFIQAANNVATIVTYLEEHYMKSFHLTWLLYNKHLYEKLIYMDRKIQHSMSTMIDLLQPSSGEDEDDCSPAEYTQLLNRFLAFDEEMSEIACLYKDCEAKMVHVSSPLNLSSITNGHSTNKTKKKKKKCKKVKIANQIPENNNSSTTTTAVDIPLSTVGTSTSEVPHQGSNGSSLGSGTGGDESSSVSSVDDHLHEQEEASSSNYLQEEQEEFARLLLDDDLNEHLLKSILESASPISRIQREFAEQRFNQRRTTTGTTISVDNDDWLRMFSQGKPSTQRACDEQQKMKTETTTVTRETAKNAVPSVESSSKKSSSISKSKSSKSSSSSTRRKESSTVASGNAVSSPATKKLSAADLILPPKPPPSTASKFQPDLRPLTIPFLTKDELILPPRTPFSLADLSAQFQSVSFTAGTFGSITSSPSNSNDCCLSSSSSSSSNCSTTTLTAAKTTTSAGQTRLSINLTRKPGSKPEHGGQKIAAILNELTSGESTSTRECLTAARKKDGGPFKKTKQQRSSATINETLLSASTAASNDLHSFCCSSSKCDSNQTSAACTQSLDHLLRHASNMEASESAIHSLLSTLHSPSCHDSSSSSSTSSGKHSIVSSTSALQTLLAQQQHNHHHHHHLHHKSASNNNNNNNKHCDFCCCDFLETHSSAAGSLHLTATTSTSTANGNTMTTTGCVTCMALPGATTSTTSVMGASLAGLFNQRDADMKERLKLKLTKRIVQNTTEQQQQPKEQQKKVLTPTIEKKTNSDNKPKQSQMNGQNNIDDLVRFIDGGEITSVHNHESHHQPATTTESNSKKNKKKKDKQTKAKVMNNEETKSTPVQSQQQQSSQKKQQVEANTTKQTASSQPSRSASSSCSSTKATPVPSKPAVVESQPLSKRKQKAKLKLEQQQQQQQQQTTSSIDESPASAAVSPPSSRAAAAPQATSTNRTITESSPCDQAPSEEEVSWITISRKQSKHKPPPPPVPSLLAAPVPPVILPTTNKQRQQQTTNTKKTTTTTITPPVPPPSSSVPSLVQQKVIPPTPTIHAGETSSTANKQQHSGAAPPRLQNLLKNHASHQQQRVESTPLNLWTSNNLHDHTQVIPATTVPPSALPSSTLLATAPSYVPAHTPPPSSLVTPITIGAALAPPSSSILLENPSSSVYWDPNAYLFAPPSQPTIIPPVPPGPVQRPTSSFSPAPGTVNSATSRCIQRPSPEPRSSSTASAAAAPFPLYSPMNYAVGSSTSAWNDTSAVNSHEQPWKYSQQAPIPTSSTTPNDFPLYDPFNSGAALTLPPSTVLTNGLSVDEQLAGIGVPHDNEIDEMDALDREIEDFKKFCFENVPSDTREKVQVNFVDRCFVRQA